MESTADVGVGAISVVIVDNQVLIANTVATALATKPDITVLGVADSCATGLAAVSEHQPDVLLLDQRLPDGLGTDVLPALVAECPPMKVLVLTSVDDDDVVVAAIEHGAAGVVAKRRRFDDLVHAVRAAAHDEAVVNPDVLRRLMPRLANRANTPGANLTNRELEVLGLVIAGMRILEAAVAMGLAPATAHAHLRSIIAKLDADTRLEPADNAATEGAARILDAIRAAARGESPVEAAELARAVRRIAEDRRDRGGIKARTRTLTAREREVLQSLARGETNDAIASALFISANTVQTHNRNILGKLGVHSKLQAVAVAAQAGVLGI